AATTVLKQLKPPNRLLVVLEGESLFNDAIALLVYRFAVGASVATLASVSTLSFAGTLIGVGTGSVVLGLVLAPVIVPVSASIHDVASAVIVQFCSTFAVWLLAERLHLSGILTMVVYAMALSRPAALTIAARVRLPSFAVWEVAVFVLNVLAFILVGLQLRQIAARATGEAGQLYAAVAVAVCLAVIFARFAWVIGAAAVSRWRCRPRPDGTPGPNAPVGLNPRAAVVVGWCGMRGTVTLAAALALPTGVDDVEPFPYRDLIVVTAFGVVLGTLVVQGLTLRPLLLRLGLRDDGTVDREVRLARVETLRAAVEAATCCPGVETAGLVLHRYELQLRRAEGNMSGNGTDASNTSLGDSEVAPEPDENTAEFDADAAVVQAATNAQRRRLIALRSDGTIGDAAFQRVEEVLDWAELDWAQLIRTGQEADGKP